MLASVTALHTPASHFRHNTVHSVTGTNTCHHVTTITVLVQILSAHTGHYYLQALLGFKHAPSYEWVPATRTSSVFSDLLDNADNEVDHSVGQQVLQSAAEESEVVSANDRACLYFDVSSRSRLVDR